MDKTFVGKMVLKLQDLAWLFSGIIGFDLFRLSQVNVVYLVNLPKVHVV